MSHIFHVISRLTVQALFLLSNFCKLLASVSQVTYRCHVNMINECILYLLEWHHGIVGVPICDEDLTSQTVNGWKRLNTLNHYSIPDNATMKLVSRHRPNSLHSESKSLKLI